MNGLEGLVLLPSLFVIELRALGASVDDSKVVEVCIEDLRISEVTMVVELMVSGPIPSVFSSFLWNVLEEVPWLKACVLNMPDRRIRAVTEVKMELLVGVVWLGGGFVALVPELLAEVAGESMSLIKIEQVPLICFG